MASTSQRALSAYLWFIAAFHLFVGLSVNLSMPFTQAIAAGYGAQVDWTPQFTYILHPLGAFMIVLGLGKPRVCTPVYQRPLNACSDRIG